MAGSMELVKPKRQSVALSRFGADFLKLRQKFEPYMGPPLVALTRN